MMHLPRPRHEKKNEKNENGRNYNCFSAIQIPTHRKMSTVVVLCGNSTIGRINIAPYAWKKLCYLEVARKSSTSTSCSEMNPNGCIPATERPNHRNSYARYFTHMLES